MVKDGKGYVISTGRFRRLPIPLRPAFNWLAGFRGLELSAIPPNGTERGLYDALSPCGDVRVIFDVGANIGNMASQFSASFPEAKIYCFEPVADTYRQLRAATAGKPNTSSFRYGVGDVNKTAYISLERESERNQIIDYDLASIDNKEQIELITIDQFCKTRSIPRIDIIKTDTEGYDLHVLRGAIGMLRTSVLFVLSEVGMTLSDTRHSYFHEINYFLSSLSFQLCGFYDTTYRSDGTVEYANALFVRSVD